LSPPQDLATTECATLAVVTQDITSLFDSDALSGKDIASRNKCLDHIWDHAISLIERSRLEELMLLVSAKDPLILLLAEVRVKNSLYFLRPAFRTREAIKIHPKWLLGAP
jgi:hypothetical protein